MFAMNMSVSAGVSVSDLIRVLLESNEYAISMETSMNVDCSSS